MAKKPPGEAFTHGVAIRASLREPFARKRLIQPTRDACERIPYPSGGFTNAV
jgi:hypothetical protein